MTIREQVSLAEYSTMRLGGPARYLVEVTSAAEVEEAAAWAHTRGLKIWVVGGGSNTVFRDEGFDGLVIVNRIKGYEKSAVEDGWVIVTAGGGEVWDDLVAQTVEDGLSGLETLSLVPGTVGAAPVQNIGAYGIEQDWIYYDLTAFDLQKSERVRLVAKDCGFLYRSSWLKTTLADRYVVTQVRYRLQVWGAFEGDDRLVHAPYYRDVERYFEEHKITDVTPRVMREAVMAIRRAKLPDPTQVANCGSFFANPIVSREQFSQVEAVDPGINQAPPGWSQAPRWFLPDGSVKLSAARLIEMAGFPRGFKDEETGMSTWPTQGLVLVNDRAKQAADVLRFRDKIATAVRAKYGVELVDEVKVV